MKTAQEMSHKEKRRYIRKWNRRYNGDHSVDQPRLREGIEFWCVGHNASHSFYIGLRDGQLYRYEIGLEWDEAKQHEVLEESPVRKTDDFFGYYGHF